MEVPLDSVLPATDATPTALTTIPTSTQLINAAVLYHLFLMAEITTALFVLLGAVSNISNILVFWRLVFSSVSNISLIVLSIFDLLTTILIACVLLSRSEFFELALSVSGETVSILVGPAFYSSTAISSWTTAVISLERCCCIMFPMKVKLIFTRRTVIILLMGMPLYQISTLIPNYLYVGVTLFISPLTNETIYVFDWTKYNRRVVAYLVLVSYSIPAIVCLFLVIVGTTLLVVKLQESADFRKSSASVAGNRPEQLSTKEKILARSVIGICIIYIVCMTPNVLVFLVGSVFPPFNFLDPVFGNFATFSLFVGIFMQSVSASINLFVYLRMMRQYRETFKKLFYCCE